MKYDESVLEDILKIHQEKLRTQENFLKDIYIGLEILDELKKKAKELEEKMGFKSPPRKTKSMSFVPPPKPGAKIKRSFFKHLTWVSLLAWRGMWKDRFYRCGLCSKPVKQGKECKCFERGPYR